jgi:DNA repair ATPase RecN
VQHFKSFEKKVHGISKVEETARMLGGVNITNSTLAHAKEMLMQGIEQ